jgi:hypothetical protein
MRIKCCKEHKEEITENSEKKHKNIIINKSGYILTTAMAAIVLLLALAAGIMLVSIYRLQTVGARIKQGQIYTYAKNIVELHEDSVKDGKLSQTIADMLGELRDIAIDNSANPVLSEHLTYADSYRSEFVIAGTGVLENIFLPHKDIRLTLFITYEPAKKGQLIPADQEKRLEIGDEITLEYYLISDNLEYRMAIEYVCMKNVKYNLDGTVRTAAELEAEGFDQDNPAGTFKWEKVRATGYFFKD